MEKLNLEIKRISWGPIIIIHFLVVIKIDASEQQLFIIIFLVVIKIDASEQQLLK